MTKERAMRLATKWANGGVCTVSEGEAEEYHKLCLEALKNREKKFIRRWSSTSKKLPKHGEMALGYDGSGIKLFQWDGYSEIWLNSCEFREKDQIPYWMPLPEPPDMGDKSE